jgi:hypothetical protein
MPANPAYGGESEQSTRELARKMLNTPPKPQSQIKGIRKPKGTQRVSRDDAIERGRPLKD